MKTRKLIRGLIILAAITVMPAFASAGEQQVAVAGTPAVHGVIIPDLSAGLKMGSSQMDVAQAIPLGRIPIRERREPQRVEPTQPTTPTQEPVVTGTPGEEAEEEVVVTSEAEEESFVAGGAMAVAAIAIIGFIVFSGFPGGF